MDLVVEVRTGRERVTMNCHGKLVRGQEADAFRRSAMLLMGGFDALTINLGEVRTLDCGGMGCLASVLEYASSHGKQVRIAKASPLVRQALEVIGFGHVLEDAKPPRLVAGERRGAAVA